MATLWRFYMSGHEQFEKLSRELVHTALELNAGRDRKAGYPQNLLHQARQHNLLILESVLNALKILFKC
jgi:hypothetical protein